MSPPRPLGPPAPGPLVDTHCHLVLLEERGLLGAALDGARQAGVEQIVSIGLDVDDSDRNRVLAESHPGVFFTVGWHPTQPASPDSAQLAALDALLTHPRAVAVGEIGLDMYFRPGYHETTPEVQHRSLAIMLELAASHDKPVVVHDRDAHGDVIAALRNGLRRSAVAGDQRAGLLHCFSGDTQLAASALALGMLCSFAGTLTYPGNDAIRETAAWIPDAALLVETDAPFLSPVPMRGRSNLPGYVAHTAGAVAALRGVDPGGLARLTTENARRLFCLPDPAGDRLVG